MDKFHRTTKIKSWDFWDAVVPPEITTAKTGTGSVTSIGIIDGGYLLLSCPALSDEARIRFPGIRPSYWDEARFKATLKFSTAVEKFRFMFSDLSTNTVAIEADNEGAFAAYTINGTKTRSASKTTVPHSTTVDLEIRWKNNGVATFYIDGRIIAQSSSFPDQTLRYYPEILLINGDTGAKSLRVYNAKLELFTYSK